MGRVVVEVMPKPEILDPQGKAVLGALPRLGFEGVSDVRQGKRFEIEVDGEASDRLDDVRRMAETLLANPVIEDFTVTLDEPVEDARSGEAPVEDPPSVEPVGTMGEDTQESPPAEQLPGEDTQEVMVLPSLSEGRGLE